MSSYMIYKQGISRALFTSFNKVKQQGIKCLYLDKQGFGPVRKISLFYFPVYQDTGNALIQERFKEKYINISYVPKSEFNNECYCADFMIIDNGKFVIVSPESYGCNNLSELVETFLFHSNCQTGFLSIIRKNLDKTLQSRNFHWYVDFFNNLKIRHAGNDLNGSWKYFVTKKEEAEYQEAFKRLFRSKVSSKLLNLDYSLDLINEVTLNSNQNKIKIQKEEELYF